MPINTPEKRKSAAAVAGVPYIPGVTPSAIPAGAQRQESAWGYSGIPVIVVGITTPAVWLAVSGNRIWTENPGNRGWLAKSNS